MLNAVIEFGSNNPAAMAAIAATRPVRWFERLGASSAENTRAAMIEDSEAVAGTMYSQVHFMGIAKAGKRRRMVES